MVETVISVVQKFKYSAEVWNPFILNPLHFDDCIDSIRRTGRLLVVQESSETAGLGDRIISLACREAGSYLKDVPRLVAAPDTPIPFAKELEQYHIPNMTRINLAIEKMIGEKSG